jgi:hypothetical protein
MNNAPFLCLAALLSSACVVKPDAVPQVQLGIAAASSETLRGMVQSESPVLHTQSSIRLEAQEQGAIIVSAEGSMELSDDTGDAWRPDNQSGRFARFDWSLLYAQELEDVLLTFGVVSYNLPNGRDFLFGVRGSTTELMLEAVTNVWGVSPSLRINYDVDEVEGIYANLGVRKDIELAEKWNLDANIDLGWMDEDQASWNYGQAPAASGFADLQVTSNLNYTLDDHTRLTFGIGISEVIDSEFQEWFDILGIDTMQTWASLGVLWSY